MKEITNFLKEIFMLKSEEKIYVGLSQFKYSSAPIQEAKKPTAKKSEIKISDLMRRSN